MIDTQLVHFLRENAHFLCSSPISGDFGSICALFNRAHGKSLTNEQLVKQFQQMLLVDSHSIELSLFKEFLVYINVVNLGLLLESLTPTAAEKSTKSTIERSKPKAHKTTLQRLNDVLKTSPEGEQLTRLRSLLSKPTTGSRLSKEHVKLTTERTPFIETCNNASHSQVLSSPEGRFSKELVLCLNSKIHFVPIIKPHTDVSLGDCSYLDTCHKLDSCRYLHYAKHLPDSLTNEISACDSFNDQIPYWERLSPYVPNGAVSNLSREVLPPQWINCDVRTFDFTTIGKFAAVIADPAWNIHMNLPYGTCNDSELLNLPLHTIQDEGVLFLWVTGRAIEVGKASLLKWGYEVKNELVWVKTNQLSRTICTGRTGHWLNHSKEHLFVGAKGKPEWLDKLNDIDVMVSSTRETSRKPDEVCPYFYSDHHEGGDILIVTVIWDGGETGRSTRP